HDERQLCDHFYPSGPSVIELPLDHRHWHLTQVVQEQPAEHWECYGAVTGESREVFCKRNRREKNERRNDGGHQQQCRGGTAYFCVRRHLVSNQVHVDTKLRNDLRYCKDTQGSREQAV